MSCTTGRTVKPSLGRWYVALGLAVMPCLAVAQVPERVQGRTVVLGPSEIHLPQVDVIDIPMPPRDAFEPSFAPHPRPPLAQGTGERRRPRSSETAIQPMSLGPADPCAPVGYVNSAVNPAGAVLHTVGEPSVAFLGRTPETADTAFYTGNRFGARSDDGGQTWIHVDPYTRFPNLNGGFCCDQRTLYLPSRDITIWQLLYLPSALTGTIRIAVADGRDGLRSDTWHSFLFNPQQFGYPTGYWFDFPDVACTDNHLYFAINVITPTPWTNVDSIVMKFPLDEIKVPGGLVNTTYWTRSATLGPGPNFRFAQGSTHTMYLATHMDSTTVRTFRNEDSSSTIEFQDHTVAPWSSASYSSILSNGVNWAARAGVFMDAGYASDAEYGFLWTAGNQAGRPQPYIRVARFRTSDDTLIAEEEIWNSQLAYLYPATVTNAVGDVGMVLATGGPSLNPVSGILLVDECRPGFAGATIYGWAYSTHGATYAGWGDYNTMQRHPVRTLSFLGTGLSMQGGTGHTDQQPGFLHFGRTRDDPAWTSIIITSPGVSGVPIVVRPTDELGKTGVSTPGYVSFQPSLETGSPSASGPVQPVSELVRRGYRLSAPATYSSGGSTWEFQHWRHRSSPTAPWNTRPDGRLTLHIASVGSTDDSAEAIYQLQ